MGLFSSHILYLHTQKYCFTCLCIACRSLPLKLSCFEFSIQFVKPVNVFVCNSARYHLLRLESAGSVYPPWQLCSSNSAALHHLTLLITETFPEAVSNEACFKSHVFVLGFTFNHHRLHAETTTLTLPGSYIQPVFAKRK